jgi:hypothetical protein
MYNISLVHDARSAAATRAQHKLVVMCETDEYDQKGFFA